MFKFLVLLQRRHAALCTARHGVEAAPNPSAEIIASRERRPPRAGVDVREVQPVALPVHPPDDIADAAPVVEPAVE